MDILSDSTVVNAIVALFSAIIGVIAGRKTKK
jgi:uncharacterized membrane protein